MVLGIDLAHLVLGRLLLVRLCIFFWKKLEYAHAVLVKFAELATICQTISVKWVEITPPLHG